MDISEQTIIDLVKGQATIAQAVVDIGHQLDKVVPALVARDTQLEESIHSVERKLWYFGGAGSVLGFLGSHLTGRFFGGK